MTMLDTPSSQDTDVESRDASFWLEQDRSSEREPEPLADEQSCS